MEKITDFLRRMADLLDEDFDKNKESVKKEIAFMFNLTPKETQ